MTHSQELIVLAVAAVTLAAAAILRRSGIPDPVVLVVAGLVVGFLPFIPDVTLNPELVLLGLLPLLVFRAALTSSARAFYRRAAPIGLLAVGLVVATAAAVGAAAHYVGHLPWAVAFVLGTAVGPTDAAAATGIARRIGLPRSLSTVLDGEALFNDATALVLYASAVTAATSGHVSAAGTVGSIVTGSVIGIAIGLGVGIAGRAVARRLDDPPIEIVLSLLLAYASYLPAEAAGASGVLAAVTAGLYLGWHNPGTVSARSRLQSGAFWDILEFLVNGALFVLVGLSFHSFSATARGPLGRLVATGTVVVGLVILVRLLWVALTGWLVAPQPAAAAGRHHFADGWRERLIVGWAGMRGAVTLAALLAVPEVTSAGRPLPGRDDVIYIGFAVILVSLVLEGLTLAPLVRRLGVAEHPSVAEGERLARIEMVQTALHHLRHAGREQRWPEEVIDGLTAQYAARLRRLEAAGDPGEDDPGEMKAAVQARRSVLDAQRDALLQLRARRGLSMTTLRTIEHDLDLEEARLH